MSTNVHTGQNGSDDATFRAVGQARPLTRAEIDTMAAPEDATGDRFYAVGRVQGVLHDGPGVEGTTEAVSVLYLSVDGERAVERWVPARLGIDSLPRVTYPPAGAAEEASATTVDNFVAVLDRHPDVDTDRTEGE
ncbi:hypothetical protein BRC81_02915 [Halobacteriales archaeon QS_1_68_20]|nr:MAG: hypothetical protein BRC81_02915 [Halobacteriales archaeon QS_1_68_20]